MAKTYIADKATQDLINQKIGETADTGGTNTTGTADAKLNAIYLGVDGVKADVDGVNSRLDGMVTPYGKGSYGDLIFNSSDFVWPSQDGYNRYVVHTKSLTIPAGQVMKPPAKCDGLYIYSQGDVTINGDIDLRGLRKTFGDIQLSATINVDDAIYTLAKGGYAPKGGASGAGGDIEYTNNPVYVENSGTPTLESTAATAAVTPTNSCAGNVNGGGAGGFGKPSITPSVRVDEHWNSSDDLIANVISVSGGVTSPDNTYGDAPTALVIIAKGKVTINGNILASGTAGVAATGGSPYIQVSSGTRTYTYKSGEGGSGAIPPSGGGPVTIICNSLINNGVINTNGSKLVSANGNDSTKGNYTVYKAAKVYSGKGGKGGTFISTAGEIKVYETGGEA